MRNLDSTLAPNTKAWKLRLFGRFQLSDCAGVEFQTKGKRHKLLIALLALSKGASATRSELGAQLFGSDDLPSSSNLSLLLNRLGAAIKAISPEPVLRISQETIGIDDCSVEIDLLVFHRLLADASKEFEPIRRGKLLASALEVWDGDLLSDIDHYVVTAARQHNRALVLKAALDLIHTPMGHEHRRAVLSVLHTMENLVREDPQLMGDVMKVYAALGLNEKVVKLFTDYEAWLEDEFGEPPGEYVTAVFKQLTSIPASKESRAPTSAPTRPSATFGRSDILRELVTYAQPESRTRIITLTGLSGIGKSHLLAEAHWLLRDFLTVESLNAEQFSGNGLLDRIAETPSDLLLLDHAEHTPTELLTAVAEQFPDLRLIIACHTQKGLPGEVVLQVPPLRTEAEGGPGPAVELLQYHAQRQLGAGYLPETRQASMYAEVAALCDGIPLALEIAGKMLATIGFQATLQLLKGDPSSLELRRAGPERHLSVGQAIRASFASLSDGSRRLIAVLASVRAPCHAGLILEGVGCTPDELQDAFLSGLIRRSDDSPVFSILDSVGYFVRSEYSLTEDSSLAEIASRIANWFTDRAGEVPIDLTLASSLSAAFWAIESLAKGGLIDESLGLLGALKPWVGSGRVGGPAIEHCLSLLTGEEAQESPKRAAACLSLAAICFHASRFLDMRLLLLDEGMQITFANAAKPLQIQRQIQLVSLCSATKDLEGAIEHGRRALEQATQAGLQPLIVQCSYNLGAICETMGNYEEALINYQSATDAFTEETDIRLQNRVNSAIARMKHLCGHDLGEVCRIYESSLMHAMDKDDRRIAAEILQNLGAVYGDMGLSTKAGLSVLIGTALLLDFGYTPTFRKLARSSLSLLGSCLYDIDERDLAFSVRVMIDRLGKTPIYPSAKKWMDRLETATYKTCDSASYSIASEAELSALLRNCHRSLQRASSTEIPPFLAVGERYAHLQVLT